MALALGVMSGTSLDGVDAALVEIVPRVGGYDVRLERFATFAFGTPLRSRLTALLPPNPGTLAELAALHVDLGTAFALAALRVTGTTQVDFVASHGQTVYHDGACRRTLQIGEPYGLRDALDATVAFDFRSADCAAGGQGAPLVPYVDALLLGHETEDRIALNLGGIANLTYVPAGAGPDAVRAFDSGPGVMLLDRFVAERTAGARCFDRDGALALAGTADARLVAALASDAYFALAPPKSTGRETFGAQFLAAQRARFDGLSLEDGCATLVQLTAHTVAEAVRRTAPAGTRVIASGGGARNPALLAALRAELGGARVEVSDAYGIDADAKEAVAFAVLGYETLRERAAGLPGVTGARRPAVLGALAPCNLAALLAKIERETRLEKDDEAGRSTGRA